jgi:class 3 adenylate cyclase/tetratricopeptide (TPR) repeat protein
MYVLPALSSYLPYPLAARLLQDPTRPLIDESERFDAAVLFADMAGFTPLAEALGHIGTEGTELLTRLLNGLFTPMIEEVHRWGGVVGKFGGDAMIVLFRGDDAAERALTCSLALHRLMARISQVETAVGTFRLQMKQGLAAGQVLQTVAGDDQRADFLFAGRPLDYAAQAEQRASADGILVHPSLVARFSPDEVKGTPIGDGYLQLQSLMRQATALPHPTLPVTPDKTQAVQSLRPFLPPNVYERILSDQETFVNEHRRITVVFVGFEGIDYDAPDASVRLGDYVKRVFETVSRFGGYVCRVDMGDKGSRVMILFGAPTTYENDEERALLCVLELQQLAKEIDSVTGQRIGVNSDRVFVGNVGSPTRQEYTAMGDGVNLAARLMQAAEPGQTLVGQDTQQAAGEGFLWKALPPIRVKGKREPVIVYTLSGCLTCQPLRLQEPSYALPMVGRKEELGLLESLLAQVQETGRGHVAALVAEAGMGKSRLAAEVIGLALQGGFLGFGGTGVSHGTTTPYMAWRPLLRGLLDLQEGWTYDQQIEAIDAHLIERHPDLVLRLPLLGDVLGLEIPDNDLTASFDADLRRRSLFAMVVDLIRGQTAAGSLLLVMEDAHWLDDLSYALIRDVAREIATQPVFLLTVYRPVETAEGAYLWDRPLDHLSEIPLGPFTLEESAELIHLKLAGRELPETLVEQIEQRAQGNPFFVDEFINLVQAQGIDLDDPKALQDIEVPDSLRTLIVSRLDQLQESEKLTIRVASVIGRLFRARWLQEIYPGGIEEEQLLQDLDRLNVLGLVPLDKPEPELEYLFRHAITQEVAYNSLAFANRRMLHGRLAGYIESTYVEDLGAWYGILVHHYHRADQEDKEFEYVQLAAQQAARRSAHRQAVEFYSRASELLHRLAPDPALVREQRYALLMGREQAYGMLGERDSQKEDLQGLGGLAAEWATSPLWRNVAKQRQAEVALRYAVFYEAISDFPAALEASEEVVKWAGQSGDNHQKIEGLIAGARALWRQGHFEQARQRLLEALSLAQRYNDRPCEGTSLHHLGTVMYFLGDHQAARGYLERALETRRALADQRGKAASLTNLAGVYHVLGDFSQSQTLSEQALAIHQAIGDRRSETGMLINLGNIYYALGNLEAARAHQQRALEQFKVIGDRRGEAVAAKNLGLALHDLGECQSAREYCEYALAINRSTGDRSGEGYSLTYLALVLEDLGDLDAAAAAYTEALQIRRELGQDSRAIDDVAGLARIALRQQQLEQALAYVEETLAWIDEHGVAGIDYPLRVYLTAGDVLYAVGQPEHAAEVLLAAQSLIEERAVRISDEATRQSFLEQGPLHQQLWERLSLV